MSGPANRPAGISSTMPRPTRRVRRREFPPALPVPAATETAEEPRWRGLPSSLPSRGWGAAGCTAALAGTPNAPAEFDGAAPISEGIARSPGLPAGPAGVVAVHGYGLQTPAPTTGGSWALTFDPAWPRSRSWRSWPSKRMNIAAPRWPARPESSVNVERSVLVRRDVATSTGWAATSLVQGCRGPALAGGIRESPAIALRVPRRRPGDDVHPSVGKISHPRIRAKRGPGAAG